MVSHRLLLLHDDRRFGSSNDANQEGQLPERLGLLVWIRSEIVPRRSLRPPRPETLIKQDRHFPAVAERKRVTPGMGKLTAGAHVDLGFGKQRLKHAAPVGIVIEIAVDLLSSLLAMGNASARNPKWPEEFPPGKCRTTS